MLDAKPTTVPFLDYVTEPWIALGRVARVLMASHGGWLGSRAKGHGYVLLDNIEGCMALAREPGSAINALGPQGHTMLTFAALLGRNDILEALLAEGADIDGTDVLGNSALHWASIMRNRPMIEHLLAHGADPERVNIFSGLPIDYDEAWDRKPPTQVDIQLMFADGTRQHVRDQATFKDIMHFELLPLTRPGIDFFMQLIVGMLQPEWVKRVLADVSEVADYGRDDFQEMPLYLKDFGEPFGWGVCTHVDIPKGTAVTGYVGDLVHTFEVTVDLFNCGYTLYTCNSQPSSKLQQSFMSHFDARRSGNLGSRVNSSHTREAASLDTKCRFWRGLPGSMMWANRDIRAGEQVSWFYGDGYWTARGMAAQPLPPF